MPPLEPQQGGGEPLGMARDSLNSDAEFLERLCFGNAGRR